MINPLKMSLTESVNQFYERYPYGINESKKMELPGSIHFNVFKREPPRTKSSLSRKEFYKITFLIGKVNLYYADRQFEINKPALIFSNPMVPYGCEAIDEKQSGFFCLFTPDFIMPYEKTGILSSCPLFTLDSNKVFFPTESQQNDIENIFQKMLEEIGSSYRYKYELLHNYVNLLNHMGLKMKPEEGIREEHKDSAARISTLFMELLDRQFTARTPAMTILNSPGNFANRLCIHVNYLNRSIKQTTGKTTSELINQRFLQEARLLLKHTTDSVAEISNKLGFEQTSYFDAFFKKHTGLTPGKYRSMKMPV